MLYGRVDHLTTEHFRHIQALATPPVENSEIDQHIHNSKIDQHIAELAWLSPTKIMPDQRKG